jgi:organic radical activating enzyme
MLKRFVRRVLRKVIGRRRRRLVFLVMLTDHCNLNCVGCNVFSPVADKAFLDLDAYTEDLKRIRGIFGSDCDVILMGGEPLLHPGLIDFMHRTRQILEKSDISIITNGMLMSKQSEVFWEAVKADLVTIKVTKYPIKVDYDAIEAACGERGVGFRYHDGHEPKSTFVMQAINPRGTSDAVSNYRRCTVRSCTSLRDGRMFPCIIAANIHIFNKHFGYDIPVVEGDYIDLAKGGRASRALRRLYDRKEPLPMCKYCDIDSKLSSKVTYGRSNKDIDEWVRPERVGK